MNLYTYVSNNPINWTDPWGLSEFISQFGIVPDLVKGGGSQKESDDSEKWKLDSSIASALAWADALGLYGEFGRMDTFDPAYANNLINPYPNAGRPGVSTDETSWDRVHFSFGAGLGYLGADQTSARTLMETWEMTEPGLWSGWGTWGKYQGRNLFEGGQRGIDRDMERGMSGYWYGKSLKD